MAVLYKLHTMILCTLIIVQCKQKIIFSNVILCIRPLHFLLPDFDNTDVNNLTATPVYQPLMITKIFGLTPSYIYLLFPLKVKRKLEVIFFLAHQQTLF